MSKIDVVRAAMVEAMKAKDKQRKDALSMLLSALKNFEIDKKDHTPITEDEANAVVKKEISSLRRRMTPRLRTGMTSARRQLTVCRSTRNLRLRI